MAPNDPSRRPVDVPPEPGKWRAIALAVLMHLLLLAALIFSLSWNNRTPGPVQAELWTDLPAPNRPEPQPQPEPTPQPEPVKPPPPPPPPPQPQVQPDQPDIAIEQERKRREQERRDAEQRQADAREQQRKLEQQREQAEKAAAEKAAADKAAAAKKAAAEKAAADKAAAEKAAAEKAAADKKAAAEKAAADKKAAAEKAAAAERDRKLREAFRNDTARAAGLEGGRAGGTADRNQAGGAGGNPGYADLVRACIKPGVVYSPSGDASGGNPTAVFQVQLLPSGSQAGAPTLKRSSGIPAFDRAVETGIRRCDPFPRPPSGRFESNIEVQYRMFD
ncbi:hypothetical protein GCM10023144_40640 [Pigmentiphaga soli]|uniref:Cell envelope integrity protein TolA n=1 Tax=Pigmentiphaga soli TaxID=1007095 RepID=A0ABP8HLQ6_9BURK